MVLVGAGCAHSHPVPAVTPTRSPAPVVLATGLPSVRETPSLRLTPSLRATAVLVPACALSRLQVALPAITAGTGGDQAAFLEFRNTGPGPCTLIGYPGVVALDSAGRPLGGQVVRRPSYPDREVLLPAGSAPIAAGQPNPAHGYATVVFNTFRSSTGLCAQDQIEQPAWLGVSLPGEPGQVRVSATAADGSGKRVQACRGDLAVTPFGTLATVNGN